MSFDHARATGDSLCGGCCEEVYPFIRWMRLEEPAGGRVVMLTAGDFLNWAEWQTGRTPCGPTPVRGTRWGQLKSLYR